MPAAVITLRKRSFGHFFLRNPSSVYSVPERFSADGEESHCFRETETIRLSTNEQIAWFDNFFPLTALSCLCFDSAGNRSSCKSSMPNEMQTSWVDILCAYASNYDVDHLGAVMRNDYLASGRKITELEKGVVHRGCSLWLRWGKLVKNRALILLTRECSRPVLSSSLLITGNWATVINSRLPRLSLLSSLCLWSISSNLISSKS